VRLTSIKLSGFKSFVDPTNFQVPGQLVGVVGPNGCGKSNIIDAVRWVLGESKASELRGESMQDVIFNGTTNRKPAGRSSVELVFDNHDGKAAGQWGQYAEIAVKRTLTRDGTSTYYINNQSVRRRDIQDIFLGTGLGPRAYAIIGQGMISRIIEARPEELRIFLEEAAGVSKYKERRRETESRLQDTRENLTRVDDIVRELNANLEKLQAQATVAQTFRSLQAEQEEKQTLLWLLRKNEAKTEQVKFFAEIDKAQTDLEAQTATLRRVETELDQMRQAHYAAGDRMHQSQGQLYQTNSEIGSLEAQIKFVVESRSRLQVQLNSLTAQRDQWQRQSAQHVDELSHSEARLEEQAIDIEQAQESAQQQHDRVPALEQAWRDAQVNSMQARADSMKVQQQIELEVAHQRNASAILNQLLMRRERLTQERSSLQLPDNVHLINLKTQLEEKKLDLEEGQQTLQQLEQRQPQLEQQRHGAQSQFQRDSTIQTQLDARLTALKQLQENVQTNGKVQPWLQKHALNDLPPMWQKLHIESGWETALESILRERTAALELVDLNLAKAFFNDTPPAKLALFAPEAAANNFVNSTSPANVDGLTPLISLLQLNDPALRALMHDWLHQVFIADDTSAGFANRNLLPPGACLVTPHGHIIGRASIRFYASDAEQDGMLVRQQEIEHLAKQLRAQQMLTEEARSKSQQSEIALSHSSLQLQQMRQRIDVLTQSAHGLQMDFVRLSELQSRFEQRAGQIDTDLTEISDQECEQQELRAISESRSEAFEMTLSTFQESHERGQTELSEKEQRLNDARLKLRELERVAQEAVYAEKSHRGRIEELKRSIAIAQEQAAQLFINMQQGNLELESLDDQAAQSGLQSLLSRRSYQERSLSDARHELDQLTQKLRHLDESRLLSERSLQPQRERITEFQLKEQAARLNQEQFAQQLADVKADETVLTQKLLGETGKDIRPAYLHSEVTRLVNAIAALGAVNLAALDELAKAIERKHFLDAQTADLTEAMNTLQDAIHKIDRETRDLLQDTFDKVNAHFGELFPILFGGGNAKLMMTGEEILDSGVQVMAQPPGKKNATIHLLSGGEKALTATALVFSMFQLNPAPFCLLDEVDAPLDDANTERFCNMVKRMSAQTQFLFISHNKIAMEMAQQLIGVTMQEQGVSRIVAVDMESATNLSTETATA
jgi:chromosome segregation protein